MASLAMASTLQRALRELRTPGDLFISGGVYEQIKNKLVCAYQSLGDRQVKNITDPVTVYRVLPDPAALSQARRTRWPGALLAVLIVSVIAILGGWYLLLLQRQIANQAPTLAGTSQTTRSAGAGSSRETPQPDTCSGTGTARKAQRQFIANAGSSPDRGATDTRNGVNPRGYIRYGERR